MAYFIIEKKVYLLRIFVTYVHFNYKHRLLTHLVKISTHLN